MKKKLSIKDLKKVKGGRANANEAVTYGEYEKAKADGWSKCDGAFRSALTTTTETK